MFRRSVLFFGGKGGVGKTTVACAAAVLSAREGARTLLISTDPAHSTADMLGATLGDDPREVRPGLHAVEIDPDAEAGRYIDEVRGRIRETAPPRIVEEAERQIELARLSPGAEEAALFDRFTRILQHADDYDRLVFDTAPTGHTLRLLTLPELMTVWIEGLVAKRKKAGAVRRMWRNVSGFAGNDSDADPVMEALEARRDRFRHARGVLSDAGRTGFVFILNPERLPILETSKALDRLEAHAIPVSGVVVNRVLPEGAGGEFLARRRDQERHYLEEVDERFSGYPRLRLPMLAEDVQGLGGLELLVARLDGGQNR